MIKKNKELDDLGVLDVTDITRHGSGVIAGSKDANGNSRVGVVDGSREAPFDPQVLAAGQTWEDPMESGGLPSGAQRMTLQELLPADDLHPERWHCAYINEETGEEETCERVPAAFAGLRIMAPKPKGKGGVWGKMLSTTQALEAILNDEIDEVTLAAGRENVAELQAVIGAMAKRGPQLELMSLLGQLMAGAQPLLPTIGKLCFLSERQRWAEMGSVVATLQIALKGMMSGVEQVKARFEAEAWKDLSEEQMLCLSALSGRPEDRNFKYDGETAVTLMLRQLGGPVHPSRFEEIQGHMHSLAALGLLEVTSPEIEGGAPDFNLTDGGWQVLGQ